MIAFAPCRLPIEGSVNRGVLSLQVAATALTGPRHRDHIRDLFPLHEQRIRSTAWTQQ